MPRRNVYQIQVWYNYLSVDGLLFPFSYTHVSHQTWTTSPKSGLSQTSVGCDNSMIRRSRRHSRAATNSTDGKWAIRHFVYPKGRQGDQADFFDLICQGGNCGEVFAMP